MRYFPAELFHFTKFRWKIGRKLKWFGKIFLKAISLVAYFLRTETIRLEKTILKFKTMNMVYI